MAYLQPNAIIATTSSTGMDPFEREHRKKAVQKFLARAEVSMVRVVHLHQRRRVLMGLA
jgi:hypothetical protein